MQFAWRAYQVCTLRAGRPVCTCWCAGHRFLPPGTMMKQHVRHRTSTAKGTGHALSHKLRQGGSISGGHGHALPALHAHHATLHGGTCMYHTYITAASEHGGTCATMAAE